MINDISPILSVDESDAGNNSAYTIKKTCLYDVDPLKPHFYIVKLGFTGYT